MWMAGGGQGPALTSLSEFERMLRSHAGVARGKDSFRFSTGPMRCSGHPGAVVADQERGHGGLSEAQPTR